MNSNKKQAEYSNNKTIECDAISNGSGTTDCSGNNSPMSFEYTQNTQDSMMGDVIDCKNDDSAQEIYDPKSTMISHGFKPKCEVSKTLQGNIYRVHHSKLDCDAIIKVTNKKLSEMRMGIDHRNGTYIHQCNENIKQEINILYYLNMLTAEDQQIHPVMIRLYETFEDEFHTFVVMEDGGSGLLGFIKQCHQAIRSGKMLLSDWKLTSKLMMKQITDFVSYLHNVKHVCHLDISLENLCIKNIEWEYNVSSKTYKLSDDFQIKFIDFGVAEWFNEKVSSKPVIDVDTEFENDPNEFCDMMEEEYASEEDCMDEISFECNKFVGKLKYEAPTVLSQQTFDARKADNWSVGVCFFMICTGCSLWNMATDNDAIYDLCVNQQRLNDLLKHWNIERFMDVEGYDLFYRIFSDQMYRADADEINNHPWFNVSKEPSMVVKRNQ